MFSRSASVSRAEIVVDFSPQDQLWAEWIAAVLASAGHTARLVGEQARRPADGGQPVRVVGVLSDFYVSPARGLRDRSGPEAGSGATSSRDPEYLIDIADTQVPPGVLDGVPVVSLGDLSEERGGEPPGRTARGSPAAGVRSRSQAALRYPGESGRRIERIPARNANFTGRDDFLRQLREALRSRGRAVVLQQPDIEGPGGIGKTQVALEYAHRFREDYNVVCWLNCEPAQYVDAALVDLGKQLREEFGASLPEEGGVTEVARQVLEYLSERATQRWLLIYDNAEDIERITDGLLPSGGGDVLITSRNQGWEARGAQSQTLKLGLFERQESIGHLRRRLPAITAAEADQLAAELADMPLAVAAAGALLNTEKLSVPEYLQPARGGTGSPAPAGPRAARLPGSGREGVAPVDRPARAQVGGGRPAAGDQLGDGAGDQLRPDLQRAHGGDGAGSRPDHLRAQDGGEARHPDRRPGADQGRPRRPPDPGAPGLPDDHAGAHVGRELEAARRNVHALLVAARPKGDVDDPQSGRHSGCCGRTSARRRRSARPGRTSATCSSTGSVISGSATTWSPGRRRAQAHRGRLGGDAGGEPDPDSDSARLLRKQLYRLRFNLANILRDLGEFEQSRELDEAVLRGQEAELGDAHPHTLQTRSSLAADLRALGKYREALELDQATYESWAMNSGFGEDYGGTLSAANNLALSNLLNGRFRDALRRDRLTLKRRAALYGAGHPRTLDSGTAVARDLIEGGKYQEAARMLADVVMQSHRCARG